MSFNAPSRKKDRPWSDANRCLTKVDEGFRAKVIRLRREGVIQRNIALRLGCSQQLVSRTLKAAGVSTARQAEWA